MEIVHPVDEILKDRAEMNAQHFSSEIQKQLAF